MRFILNKHTVRLLVPPTTWLLLPPLKKELYPGKRQKVFRGKPILNFGTLPVSPITRLWWCLNVPCTLLIGVRALAQVVLVVPRDIEYGFEAHRFRSPPIFPITYLGLVTKLTSYLATVHVPDILPITIMWLPTLVNRVTSRRPLTQPTRLQTLLVTMTMCLRPVNILVSFRNLLPAHIELAGPDGE